MKDSKGQTWIPVGKSEDFPEGQKIEKTLDAGPILIARQNDHWYAFEALCPHMGRSLERARIKGNALECVHHNMIFDLQRGNIIYDSGFIQIPDLKVYRVRVENGNVYLNVA